MKKAKSKSKQARKAAERKDFIRIVCLNGTQLKEVSKGVQNRYWRQHSSIKSLAGTHNAINGVKNKLRLEDQIDRRLQRLNDWLSNEFDKARAKKAKSKKTQGKKPGKKTGQRSRRASKQ